MLYRLPHREQDRDRDGREQRVRGTSGRRPGPARTPRSVRTAGSANSAAIGPAATGSAGVAGSGSGSPNRGQPTGSCRIAKKHSARDSGTKMISNGIGSSRPTSSIPVPGTSQAIASNAGNCVTAANTHPGSHHQC